MLRSQASALDRTLDVVGLRHQYKPETANKFTNDGRVPSDLTTLMTLMASTAELSYQLISKTPSKSSKSARTFDKGEPTQAVDRQQHSPPLVRRP